MIEEVRAIVKKESEKVDWDNHLKIVVKYAKILAEELKQDEELIEIAALLHDIGRIRHGGKDHEKTGAIEAEKILRSLNYAPDKIEIVKQCVAAHRGQSEIMPRTIPEKIIANADAMAHFDAVLWLVNIKSKKERFDDVLKWIDDKLERDWNKKMTIPYAKKMMKEKYDAARIIIEANKKCLED
jgi:putative nucleotidyltransferase with HDIG domain